MGNKYKAIFLYIEHMTVKTLHSFGGGSVLVKDLIPEQHSMDQGYIGDILQVNKETI